MKIIPNKIKPTKGYAHVFHLALSAVLPMLVFVLVRISFSQIAALLILMSKWRMLTVRIRFWPAIIRASSIDIIVGLSTVVFMAHATSMREQFIFTLLFIAWQIWIKPGRSVLSVSAQSYIGQTYGLMALYVGWPDASLGALVFASWLITYVSARHYLGSFEESHSQMYSFVWSYFSASLTWVAVHWLLFYSFVPQVVLLLTIFSAGLGSLYFLDKTDKYSKLLQRQILFITIAIVVVMFSFSEWGSKII